MRLFILVIWVVPVFLLSLPVHLYFKHLSKKDLVKCWEKSHRYVRGAFKTFLFLAGTKITVIGKENIPKDTAVLYVGNHRSYFDIIISQVLVPGHIGYVAKKEFLKHPFINLYMRDIGCIFLDRENAKEGLKAINQGAEYMKMGHSIGLFPEGTRNSGDTLLPFKEGGYKMAEKSKCPIVVMSLSGMDKIFEANKFHLIWKRHVVIEFDKPVYPSELSKEDKKAFYAGIPDRILEMQKNHVL